MIVRMLETLLPARLEIILMSDRGSGRLRSPERLARFLCLMMLATAYALSMGSYVVAKTAGQNRW